jgi:hypothetical protein
MPSADHHRHSRTEHQPRQHVTTELVGPEQVFGAAAGLPEWRFEARDETADFGIVRRQHVGEDRDQSDDDEDQGWNHREVAEPYRYPPPADPRR